MTREDEASNPLWDPFGLWRELSRATEEQFSNAKFVTADLPTTSTPLQWLVDAGRSRLVGRRVGLDVGGNRLEFEVDDVTLAGDSLPMGAGQADAITVSATEVSWGAQHVPGSPRGVSQRPHQAGAATGAGHGTHRPARPAYRTRHCQADRVASLVVAGGDHRSRRAARPASRSSRLGVAAVHSGS